MAGLNFSSLPCQESFLRGSDGAPRRVICLRQAFVLSTGRALDEHSPLTLIDRYSELGALVSPSDVAVERAGTSVFVHGQIVSAATDEPVLATVRVGAVERRLCAFGPRHWVRSGAGYQIRSAGTFEPLDLDWRHAFGGSFGEEQSSANPVGLGFFSERLGETAEGVPLPRLELADARMQTPQDRPPPAAIAAVAPGWEPRRSWAGTYDEAWQRTRAPYPPDDLDPRFADEGSLVIRPALRGGEAIELSNIGVAAHLRARVPSPTVRIDLAGEVHRPVIDHLHLDPARDRACLVLRVTLPHQGPRISAPSYLVRLLEQVSWRHAP